MDNYFDYEAELGKFVHHFALFEKEMNSHIVNLTDYYDKSKGIAKVLTNVKTKTKNGKTILGYSYVKSFRVRLKELKQLIESKKHNKFYDEVLEAITTLEEINLFRNDVVHGFLTYDTSKNRLIVTPNKALMIYDFNDNRNDIDLDFREKIDGLHEIQKIIKDFVEIELPGPTFAGRSKKD